MSTHFLTAEEKQQTDAVFKEEERLAEEEKDTVDEKVPPNRSKYIRRFNRCIVIPVEDAESAKRILLHYINECKKPNDKLYLFHSVHFAPTSSIGGTSGLFHTEQLRRQAMTKKVEVRVLQDQLEKFLAEQEILAKFYARDGERAGANIVKFAREKGANMIIMASKQQNKLMNAVLGQTSDYVLKHAGIIPVTVVPPLPVPSRKLERQDSDTSCPGDFTYGHKRKPHKFFIPTRRRLKSEPSVLEMNEIIHENAVEKGVAQITVVWMESDLQQK